MKNTPRQIEKNKVSSIDLILMLIGQQESPYFIEICLGRQKKLSCFSVIFVLANDLTLHSYANARFFVPDYFDLHRHCSLEL
jgi:hypothetical protein